MRKRLVMFLNASLPYRGVSISQSTVEAQFRQMFRDLTWSGPWRLTIVLMDFRVMEL